MLIHELTRAQCLEVLMRMNVGRLACARHDQPYIVPVSFYFDGSDACLYSFSTLGQKIRWMRENPRVCVEVDEIADQVHWTTVIVTGRYEEIQAGMHAGGAQARALKLFQQRSDCGSLPRANLPPVRNTTRRSSIAYTSTRLAVVERRRPSREVVILGND
jgi:uncharacterized protein